MKIHTLALAAALLLPTLATAQPIEVALEPTRAGMLVGASGSVLLEALPKGLEVFTLSVSAKVENRENLRIEVLTKGGSVDVGTLRMLLGRGTREIWNSIEPSKIFPLEIAYRVVVWRGKTAVLAADLPR